MAQPVTGGSGRREMSWAGAGELKCGGWVAINRLIDKIRLLRCWSPRIIAEPLFLYLRHFMLKNSLIRVLPVWTKLALEYYYCWIHQWTCIVGVSSLVSSLVSYQQRRPSRCHIISVPPTVLFTRIEQSHHHHLVFVRSTKTPYSNIHTGIPSKAQPPRHTKHTRVDDKCWIFTQGKPH